MNTNDFSKCKVGDKLWSIQLGECVVESTTSTSITGYPIMVGANGRICAYTIHAKFYNEDSQQSLFFSNPNIIAPPEPVRLPDYKPGEWVAVWDYGDSGPCIRQFNSFSENRRINTTDIFFTSCTWGNHCSLSELPEVLAKWGEK